MCAIHAGYCVSGVLYTRLFQEFNLILYLYSNEIFLLIFTQSYQGINLTIYCYIKQCLFYTFSAVLIKRTTVQSQKRTNFGLRFNQSRTD